MRMGNLDHHHVCSTLKSYRDRLMARVSSITKQSIPALGTRVRGKAVALR
jgi:hypothetical protein